ncbi:hypothetical protein TRFO_28442 [Tritrichomonas foetus]|uniref:Uncharacterized protein n=1 Tax=Tritrichomonas foetus TaxID=1144522 RepID=A0A1J4JYN5_9EUKA|nr:hypothetical protein TRFO_28442 [Tritrichomonas foetus]|eukprot:OHT04083.1 hypothetical protein TRFO_28442 [Tritrichomonas foetus]
MTHSTRGGSQNNQPAIPSHQFDIRLFESHESTTTVHDFMNELVNKGAEILYMKYIQSQICPYASRTLARELVMNSSWAAFPLDNGDISADVDDDIELPLIDEWAGGVLPVRDTGDGIALRNSITPMRETRKTATTNIGSRGQKDGNASGKQSPMTTSRTVSSVMNRTSRNKNEMIARSRPKPPLTEAQIITRKFDEAKKKTNTMMKSVTVDSDFSVIQITEPKNLPPSLIVPKVTTKKPSNKQQKVASTTMPRIMKPVAQKNDLKRKRRTQSRLIEQDQPIFDEEIAEVSYSDRFVCAPGVTFKDGSTVKSRPQQSNTTQLTRAQYNQYLEEMKRGSDIVHA